MMAEEKKVEAVCLLVPREGKRGCLECAAMHLCAYVM